MRFEAGKRYVRRNGTVTRPLVSCDGGTCVMDSETGMVFSPLGSGRALPYESKDDLMLEYKGLRGHNPAAIVRDDLEEVALFSAEGVSFTDTTPTETRGFSEELAAAYTVQVDGAVIKDGNIKQGIDAVLDERGSRYGDFAKHAEISQELQDVMKATPKWAELSCAQREALEMIAHKIGRILNGDVTYVDSWTDIVGYARLGETETKKLGEL